MTKEMEGGGILGGWKPLPGEKRLHGPRVSRVPASQEQTFSDFAEASRARWDIIEYLKVNFKQALRRWASRRH